MQLTRVSLAVTLAVLRGIALPAQVSAEARTELAGDEQLDLAHSSALGLQRSHSLKPRPVSEQALAELVEEEEPLDWTQSSVLGLQRTHSMLIRRSQKAAAEAPRPEGSDAPRRSVIRTEAPSSASPAQKREQPTV